MVGVVGVVVTGVSYTGRVAAFDEAIGLGEVVAGGEGGGEGGRTFGFHCTQIAGGSRTIPVGAEVTFEVVPGRLGRWEATGVAPVPVGAGAG